METYTSYRPWYDKATEKTFLKYDTGKCLHYYFYFIDKELGLCYLRVPTWCPFRLQFYFNGRNWLAFKLSRCTIPYVLQDNALLSIGDFKKAQELSDNIRVEDLHRTLDLYAHRYCPVFRQFGLSYHWSIMQAEYATDIIFKRQADLRAIYGPLVRTAIHSVKPENIASFPGRKLHGNYQGDMGNNFDTRILGTRIKHRMGALAIKMYDKFGIILRIEKIAPMKKNIYSLFPLGSFLKAANRRCLEFISTFDDPGQGIKHLDKISKTVESDNRTYKGFNFYSDDD